MVLALYRFINGRLPAHIRQPIGSLKFALRLVEGEELHLLDSADKICARDVFSLSLPAICLFLGISLLSFGLQLLLVADLTENALLALSLCVLGHLRQHVVLVEIEFLRQLLNQEDICVDLRELAGVDPIELQGKGLLLECCWETIVDVVGSLRSAILAANIRQLQVELRGQWQQVMAQLTVTCA